MKSPEDEDFMYPPQYKVASKTSGEVYTLTGRNSYAVLRQIASITNRPVEDFKIISWPDARDEQ